MGREGISAGDVESKNTRWEILHLKKTPAMVGEKRNSAGKGFWASNSKKGTKTRARRSLETFFFSSIRSAM